MNITIRRAVKEDCAPMMQLIRELALYEKAPEAVTVDFNHFVDSGFGPNPVWYAFVATLPHTPPGGGEDIAKKRTGGVKQNDEPDVLPGYIERADGDDPRHGSEISNQLPLRIAIRASGIEDEVVGFALYYIRYSTWKGQRLYLEDLLVTGDLRRMGIGKLLFDRLIKECKEKKYSGMVWQVLDWNESAINFYKKYNTDIESGWLNCSLSF